MRIHSAGAASLFAVALLVQWPVRAQAQPVAPRVEIWGALSGVVTAPSGTLASAYSPPLLLDGDFTSSAGQTLSFDGNRGPGWQAGVNVFPSRHVGLQFLADRASVDLTGTNGAYSVALNYTSVQPPNSQPVPVAVRTSSPWPATSGSLAQLSLGFNVIARTDPSARASASISGGLSYYRLTGTIEPLGFTEFHLGGHSVLFSDEFHLAVMPDQAGIIGFNLGGDVSGRVGDHAALIAGYRFLGGPTADMPVRIAAIVNSDQIFFSDTIDNIAKVMALQPARVRVSGSRAIVGLKLIF